MRISGNKLTLSHNTACILYAVPIINDVWSSDAPPPSGSTSNNNVIAGTVGFLLALVVTVPLIIVSVFLYLLYTRRVVAGRLAHNQTHNTTGTVEEYSMTEIVVSYSRILCELIILVTCNNNNNIIKPSSNHIIIMHFSDRK